MNNLKYSNTTLINFIMASIIPFLIWGPFFPDLIVSVSALFFLYYVVKNKNFYYFSKIPLIFFFIFCIYCILISIFVAKDTLLSFESSLFYFRIGLFSCLIWHLIDKNKSISNYFYYALISCFSILVIDGYFQYFTGKNIFGFLLEGIQITSLFEEKRILGSYLSRLFPLLFALFLVKKKMKYEIYFVGLLFILVDVLIFLSGERAAFFFLNLSTVFIIILIKEYQKFRLMTFIVAIICITILSINSVNLSQRMFQDPATDMGFVKSSKDSKSGSKESVIFTPVHDSLIRTAYKMFKSQPILGHGPKMFRIQCKNEKYAVGISPCMTHPHNFYIQLLAETGIIGFLFLFSTLCYLLYASLKQFNSIMFGKKRPFSDYQICLLAGILITVWPISPNGNFFNNWLMIIYSLPVGFYLQSIYKKNDLKIKH